MKFFSNKVFRRVFLFYSAVIIVAMSILSIFISNNIKKTITTNQIYFNRKIIDDTDEYFKEQYESSKLLMNSLYSKPLEIRDTVRFLNSDYQDYIKNRLDNYYNYEGYVYGGINSYVKSCFNFNSNIENVIFYSLSNDRLAIFDENGGVKYINDISKKISMDENQEKNEKALVSLLEPKDNKNQKHFYYTFNQIKNPDRLDTVGTMIIQYKLDRLNYIFKSYEKSKSNVIVINKNGQVIYDSSGKYNNTTYPYNDMLKTTDKPVMLDKLSYLDMATSSLDVIVLGILPVDDVMDGNAFIINTSYIVALLLIIIAEIIVFLKIESLSKRVNNIIIAMKEVQKGNFKVKINTGNEDDEFSMISESFNDMCEKLDDYVNRVYLSEIKQKNAEMMALQSQINPHFLYNSLESIRMKAISNGDKESGKMLYNLAVLYRNMVKGKTYIPIKQELYHCKLYLELFKFRYLDKFDYFIEVPEELEGKEIIKFSLQPIIENFIIHGIDMDREDNYILITAEQRDQDIIIHIEDNGTGISEDKIQELNTRMENLEHSDSIGLLNVHERISYAYGDKYGLLVEGRNKGGTIISITIPIKEIQEI